MQKKYFFIILLFLSLSACSILTSAPKIEYYTLNPVRKSCLSELKLTGNSQLLGDKIILRKGPHEIGALPNVYWFQNLKDLLPQILVGNINQTRSATIHISTLHYNVKKEQLQLRATAKICSAENCQNISKGFIQSFKPNEKRNFAAGYQRIFEKLNHEICKANL